MPRAYGVNGSSLSGAGVRAAVLGTLTALLLAGTSTAVSGPAHAVRVHAPGTARTATAASHIVKVREKYVEGQRSSRRRWWRRRTTPMNSGRDQGRTTGSAGHPQRDVPVRLRERQPHAQAGQEPGRAEEAAAEGRPRRHPDMHAIDGMYPSSTTLKTNATAFSFQAGGGLNISLARGFGVRAIELDYLRTSLPNGTTDSQHDLRLAFGITYRLHH